MDETGDSRMKKLKSINDILRKGTSFRPTVVEELSEECVKIEEELVVLQADAEASHSLEEVLIDEPDKNKDAIKKLHDERADLAENLAKKLEEYKVAHNKCKEPLNMVINFSPIFTRKEEAVRQEFRDSISNDSPDYEVAMAKAKYLSKLVFSIKMDEPEEESDPKSFAELIGHSGDMTWEIYFNNLLAQPMLRATLNDMFDEVLSVKKPGTPISK